MRHFYGVIGRLKQVQIDLTVGTSKVTGFSQQPQQSSVRLEGTVTQDTYFKLQELDLQGRTEAYLNLNGLLGPGNLSGQRVSGLKRESVSLGQITEQQLDQLHAIWKAHSEIKNLALYDDYGCASRTSGVLCWGAVRDSPSLVSIGPGSIAYIALPLLRQPEKPGEPSHLHSCKLTDGRVFCTGDNFHGELGARLPEHSDTPIEVKIPEPVTQVADAAFYSCALGVSGKVWCWGDNGLFQTGNESRNSCSIPNGRLEDTHEPCNRQPVAVRGLP